MALPMCEFLVAPADSPPARSSAHSGSPGGAWSDELLHQARQGERDAVNRIIEGVRDYLLLVANRTVKAELRPKAAPSDLVQEACLDGQSDFAQFSGHTHQEWRAWMRQILLSRISHAERRYLRTAKRDTRREVPLDPNRHDENSGKEASSRDAAFDQADFDQLKEVLPSLPEDYRRVIQLRNWQRLSFSEIGAQMSRSAEAARKLWGRAVERLSRELRGRRPPG
jgi:RNA polymerase sigma-70 factor (ECF subfamily)